MNQSRHGTLIREYRAARRGDTLIVAKRDRLARDTLLAAWVEKEVAKRGGTVVSAAGEGNGTDPSDILMRRIVDAFAEYERLLIRARTKAALRAKRNRGERTGRHEPFGYRFGSDGKTVVPIPEEQIAIELMLDWRRQGHSFARIARQLDAEGVKPKRTTTWQPDSVRRICQRSMQVVEAVT